MAFKTLKFNPVWFRTLSLSLKVSLLIVLIFAFILLWGLAQIPSDKKIRGCMTTNLYKVYLCPGSESYTRISNISQSLQKAVVLTEDSSFWTHQGFDLQEMQNSLKANLEKGRYARGGSTITQQLAKNLFLSKEKTLTRKLLEAVITVRLEKTLSKKEILERYLNVVQFGKDIFGIKKAAQFYFNKTPANLSIVESAFLTFLLPSPEVYSQSFYKKRLTAFAQNRLSTIIDRLYQYNRISEDEYVTAKADLEYFLTGKEPPVIDPSVEFIDEEDALIYDEEATD
ncbi:MAG: transglycosylase domain-containing protein [Pseudobdellovibrionaceae bacterium]